MSDAEQKQIFAYNLNRQLDINKKTQKEVAEALNVSPQTFNTWCQGIALPRMGKIQLLADYFGIGKSDLTDPPFMKRVDIVEGEDLDVIIAYRKASPERKESIKLLLGLIEGA